MGALGVAVKDQVEALIDDANLKSEATVNTISFSEGSFGGYSAGTASITDVTTVNCIPSNYIQTRTGLQLYGDLQEGELRMLIKTEETIDAEDDSVIFQSEKYWVREIKPIFFNEEIVAKAIIMSKQTQPSIVEAIRNFTFENSDQILFENEDTFLMEAS